MKIAIIEDDLETIEAISLCFDLRWPHVEVVSANDGSAGVNLIEKESPDIVILDVGLPDIDGFEVCRRIRLSSDVPVVILTARDQGFDMVKGLEAGADDYVTKPFSHIELLARAKAVMRRSVIPDLEGDDEPVSIGRLWIDFAAREVCVDGQKIKLNATEYDLLCILARNAGRVVPHRVFLERVWGADYTDSNDYLKVYIQRLRVKLHEDDKKAKMIVSERGVGYKLVISEISPR